MSKPLELWLSTKLGRIVRLESTEMSNLLFDGRIFAELLASYGILAEVNFPKAKTFAEGLANLIALNETLSLIGLEQDDHTLQGIAHRDQSLAVKLLFEIYIHLEQYWPYSKGSVLGEPSFSKSRSSDDNIGRIGSSQSTVRSDPNRSSSSANDADVGSELDSSVSLSRVLDVYKEDTIAACRQEMTAHRTSFGRSPPIKK